uniref:Reverse transcriptase domain-containing protein n=1 Tax=Tanacetum cinerariifolium TaxID=118510 RepID=A0A6L2MI60_TANCI|nr:hypothetical protein [Tanacetum cinerariifolium]
MRNFLAIAITLDLPTVDPEDFIIMGDEHLDTILKTESDKFIKSSVENLVPSPSESKNLFDGECDLPLCDDFTTFSNLLFDAGDYFSSSDNGSFSNENIPKEIYLNPLFDEVIISIKIDPHHFNAESDLMESLLNQDSSIISSSKIDSLLDEFAGELIPLKSIPPGIGKANYDPEEEIRLIKKLLYDNLSPRPPEEFIFENSDAAIESFSSSPIPIKDSDSLRDEIDLSLTSDDSMPPDIEDDDYDSEGDMLILEELLSNDSLLLPENDSFHFDIPSSPRLSRNHRMMKKLSPIWDFYCQSEEVSDDEEVTQVKVSMALVDDELLVGKNHAHNGEWIDITMRKVERLNTDIKLPKFNTGRILVPESEAVNESLKFTEASTNPKSSKDSEAESLTPLHPLKIL